MNFFVTAIGHSGTMWLAHVLGCEHEAPDPRPKHLPHPWTPFPVERFWRGGPDYGEVNGMLRYHLSGQYPGRERLIPRRAWLRRDARAIIASWMNDDLDREEWELASVCHEVLWHYHNLERWAAADPGARVVDLETLSTDLDALREFAAWLGHRGQIEAEAMRPYRPTPEHRKRFRWGEREERILRTVGERVGIDFNSCRLSSLRPDSGAGIPGCSVNGTSAGD